MRSGDFGAVRAQRVAPIRCETVVAMCIGQLVVAREIGGAEFGATFQADHIESGARTHVDPDASARAGSDHADVVDGLAGHGRMLAPCPFRLNAAMPWLEGAVVRGDPIR